MKNVVGKRGSVIIKFLGGVGLGSSTGLNQGLRSWRSRVHVLTRRKKSNILTFAIQNKKKTIKILIFLIV